MEQCQVQLKCYKKGAWILSKKPWLIYHGEWEKELTSKNRLMVQTDWEKREKRKMPKGRFSSREGLDSCSLGDQQQTYKIHNGISHPFSSKATKKVNWVFGLHLHTGPVTFRFIRNHFTAFFRHNPCLIFIRVITQRVELHNYFIKVTL